jgi:hypothetical protein
VTRTCSSKVGRPVQHDLPDNRQAAVDHTDLLALARFQGRPTTPTRSTTITYPDQPESPAAVTRHLGRVLRRLPAGSWPVYSIIIEANPM